jgi:tRNA 2-thiouridine synthesizing protein E
VQVIAVSPDTHKAVDVTGNTTRSTAMTKSQPDFDEDGFLVRPDQWSESFALEMARSSGIEQLNDHHWQVLRYLRNHFLAHGTLPVERTVCRESGLDRHCIERLFGNDLKRAWRIAGLPNPGEEAKTYMAQRSTKDHL